MNKDSKIYIAGHRGLLGTALVNCFKKNGYDNLILRTHAELDLLRQRETAEFFEKEKPEYVVLAAARVGGIIANNTYRADFLYENLQIQNNVIHESYLNDVKKLLFLGSSCIYPKNAPQPMPEDCLLTSELEYTNEPYAIAKIAGLRMCESYNLQYGTDFIAAMPTNLYGPGDNYDLEKSHVLPALIRKMHLGKCLMDGDFSSVRRDLDQNPVEGIDGSGREQEILTVLGKYGITGEKGEAEVELWGTGAPMREFLHSDDMADACVYILERVSFEDLKGDGEEIRNNHINIGTGKDISIKALAAMIQEIVGFEGSVVWDEAKPNGTMRKLQDVTKLHGLEWHEHVGLEDGVRMVYADYREA